jgi:hypothetical protein
MSQDTPKPPFEVVKPVKPNPKPQDSGGNTPPPPPPPTKPEPIE